MLNVFFWWWWALLLPTADIIYMWPRSAIWRHRSRSIMAQVMAGPLTALSHYLSQCWLIMIQTNKLNFISISHVPIHTFKVSCGFRQSIREQFHHYDDVIMSEIASQITSLTIDYSTVLSGADQSKHQSSASLAFVWEIHRWPVNFPHKWPVTRKRFPFDDVIMTRSAPKLSR